ncbi:DUF3368 domain-containing protein [Oscillatoria sp. HE19RPO]|uniref:DUF3368 domain-containing protein n=1 Tax=Oscillatoria sp. HE19RPO TaxID=2954806 RepID=UPI0020C30293|nr:DUF3368 domain-containing protein [Oscillatoria sp. HE19RPO]
MTVVSNTSPITNLAAVGQIDLLRQLYGTIIIPQAVYHEMTRGDDTVPGKVEVQTLSWIQVQPITNPSRVTELTSEIHLGEAEAIILAMELQANGLLLDDYRGRMVATQLGLKITGVLGVLLVAKGRGLIPSVQPVMDDLIAIASFRIGDRLYGNILQAAGE